MKPAATQPGRLGGDYLAILASQAASLGLGLASVALVTRLLAPQGYGRVALALAVMQLVMAAAVRLTAEALAREGRAGRVLGSWLLVLGAALGVSTALPTGFIAAAAFGAALTWLLSSLPAPLGRAQRPRAVRWRRRGVAPRRP